MLCPGAPVLILTGTSTVRMIGDFLNTSNNVDIWSEGCSRPTVAHLEKADLVELSDHIKPCLTSILRLKEIELSHSFDALPIAHDRLIRIFAKKRGASVVRVKEIGGGYSDAKVYFLALKDQRGVELHSCIAKCGKRVDIDTDSKNFNESVSRLKPSATPRQIDHLRFGAANFSAVFYGLAKEYPYSFFSASERGLTKDEMRQSLVKMMLDWHANFVEDRKQIKEIRRSFVSDTEAQDLIATYELSDALDFENRYVQCKVSCIHGDLHGENVLVDTENNLATLIDYGDVKNECSIIDPLTLECSFLFHSSSPKSDWPSQDNLNNWHVLDKYLLGCPYSDDIRFCRDWLRDIGVGNRELAACLYAYALRQLKYDDVEKERALTLINVAFELFDRS